MAKVGKDFIKKTTKGAGEMTQWFKSAHCSCKRSRFCSHSRTLTTICKPSSRIFDALWLLWAFACMCYT